MAYSDEEWQEMLGCVRGLYAPFDIAVTDIDPGQESHFDSRSEAPFEYQAPTTLGPGMHDIEVRVFDDRDQFGEAHIQIVQEPCLQTAFAPPFAIAMLPAAPTALRA